MIFFQLFIAFLKIGAVSFGGGYGMISLLEEEVILHGWLTEDDFLNFIAVSESTPGPLAVNMATFIGSSQGGLLGAFAATLGVVLPSFVIILIIASLMQSLLKYKSIDAFLCGIRPCTAGLITATAFYMMLSVLFGVNSVQSKIEPNWKAVFIFALIVIISFAFKRIKKKSLSPIVLILLSAGLGIVCYSVPT